MKLKYLFEAELKDGTVYLQNTRDQSIKSPPDEFGNGKSCYFDIQEDVENFNVKKFTLKGHRNYAVNLEDGTFEIDGNTIMVEGEQLPGPGQFKLIYFRIRRAQFNIVDQVGTPSGELPVRYMIGWQTNIDGKNYTQKIIIE